MIKHIYLLWLQGFDKVPPIVYQCIKSWKHYNPDWQIFYLTESNIHKLININLKKYKQLEKCHLSDIIRLLLLNKYGGVWADATTFCNKSLSSCLPTYTKEGFFAFDKPGPDRLLSNWFLYSEPNNYIIKCWTNATLNYYETHNKAHTYFINHYLFGDLYKNKNNLEFKQMWDKVPKLSANGQDLGPHYLQEKGLFSICTNVVKKDITSKITPLYKLTWKCDFNRYNAKTNLHYLFSTIG